MKLSENLKRIRKDNNLSQEQLAEKLGVSRQAVSKWESGQSYPEMDKVLLICKMFNYNIDELMNENVKEVNETKQAKTNVNKYIEDFFEFITKTVDMFSSMKFKQKIKCLSEQVIIVFVLMSVFAILGQVCYSILHGLLGGLPDGVFSVIRNILSSIYLFLSIVLGTTILLHIFKVRYLDYYEIIKEDEKEGSEEGGNEETIKTEKEDKNKKKIFIEKKKEKIVIRDPEHLQSKFLTGIIRIALWCIKFLVACFASMFVFSFVAFVTLLVLSFLFVKTGLVFVGTFLGIISAIIINFIILELVYNFIVSKKCNKNRTAILLIISLVLCGVSIGVILIGVTNFNYTDVVPDEYLTEDTYQFEMTENLSIHAWHYPWHEGIKYVETDSNNIKMTVKHLKCHKIYYFNENEKIEFGLQTNSNIMEFLRDIINDINNKEIMNYDYIPEATIYASKENIEKLKQNALIKEEQEKQNQIDNLNNTIYELENKVYEVEAEKNETELTLENEKRELENQIVQKDSEIMELQNQINNLKLIINQQ